jgi:ABC-type transport system involved in multi-copper enzyme maturation permease subunit
MTTTEQSDFPDWLSPMLIKELRQGIRSRMFVSTFILLQGLLILSVAVGLEASRANEDTSGNTSFFWFAVAIPVLLMLPWSGLGAVSSEMKANTLELILLTRLSAWQIILGKWLSIFAQTALVVCGILPYLVLRYFIGGVDLTGELLGLGFVLAASGVISAMTTGISPYDARLARGLLGFSFFILGGYIFPVVLFGGIGAGPLAGVLTWGLYAGIAVGAVLVVWLMLEVGASKIAPLAENHAAPKRAIALAALAAAFGVGLFSRYTQTLTIGGFALAVGICAGALCEEPRWIPAVYRPLARRSGPVRALGALFYPGWFTGVPFTALVFGGFAALMWHQKMLTTYLEITLFSATCGAVLLPAALIRALLPKTTRAGVWFFGFQAASTVLTICCFVNDGVMKPWVAGLLDFVPIGAFMMAARNGLSAKPDYGQPGCVALGSLLVLLVLMFRPWMQMRRMERLSLEPAPAREPLA